MAWIAAVDRKTIAFDNITKSRFVCSRHFHKGKPAYEMLENDPDWAPSLHLGYSDSETDTAHSDAYDSNTESGELSPALSLTFETEENSCQDDPQIEYGTSSFRAEMYSFWEENQELRRQLDSDHFFADCDIDKVKYFTGLSSASIFMGVLSELMPLLSNTEKSLTPFQMLLLTFMRLRLDLPIHLLAHLFLVSPNTVYRAFSETVSHVYTLLKDAIIWPDRDTLKQSMPHQFVEVFGNRVAIVIDWFEIFIEKPYSVMARVQTSDNDKHKYTIKYLTGVTPKGAIIFVSQGWGGRLSDKHITLHCGVLEKLVLGDIVLTERGFGVQEKVGLLCEELKLPAFKKRTFQLEHRECAAREISQLSSSVQRATGNTCQKYKILGGTIPISLALQCDREKLTLLDKIVAVCCILTNLCPDVE